MKLGLPVSSSGLRERKLASPGLPMSVASLFPLFDRAGAVRRVLLVEPGSSAVWWFDPAEARVCVPLFGPIRIDAPANAVRPLRARDQESLDDLWHFDPKWTLKEPRYDDVEAAPVLRASNCCEELPGTVTQVLFRRDLSRANGTMRREKGGYQWTRFPVTALPEGPRLLPILSGPGSKAGPWRLSPFWLRS